MYAEMVEALEGYFATADPIIFLDLFCMSNHNAERGRALAGAGAFRSGGAYRKPFELLSTRAPLLVMCICQRQRPGMCIALREEEILGEYH